MSDGPADVVVSDGRKSTVEAVVSIGDRERSLTIPGRDQWVSDDVIGNGETTSVSVTTADGGETAIEWESERENEQIARFAILDDESEPIRARLQTKSPCPAA